MNTAKHIAHLLKFHECVIIPEFGGFITNYKPAEFNKNTSTFIPPSKEVIFNFKINNNDGLLINHLVEVEHLEYHQAQQKILNFVDQLHERLNQGIKIKYPELGTFELDRNGSILFSESTKFDLIEAYGLEAFNYTFIQQSKNLTTFEARPAIRVLRNRGDILKIAASITLLFALSVFPVKNNEIKLQSSNLNPIQILNTKQPTLNSNKEFITKIETESAPSIKKIDASAPFILVGGSFLHLKNAEQLSNEITRSGEQPEIFRMENGYYRVIINSFLVKDEALTALSTYRTKHPNLKIWLSKR
jgi:nucleoid DNA-binding protein